MELIKEIVVTLKAGDLEISSCMDSGYFDEAVFQITILLYNLFRLFKCDYLDVSEYRQQIERFCLKYVFLITKILKTTRSAIIKLFEEYPFRGVYENAYTEF